MIDNSLILKNPHISEGYYFSKIITIETEGLGSIFPKILVKLELHQDYELENNIFHSILHPTENSYFHYKNFYNTFLLGKSIDKIEEAIGQWGSIEICSSEFQDLKYSVVKFTYQPRTVMIESFKIWREENG